ncbi:hypothetical protein [Carnobacterium divergens]|nr:hypothetical protein [Carnobacterium divergens]
MMWPMKNKIFKNSSLTLLLSNIFFIGFSLNHVSAKEALSSEEPIIKKQHPVNPTNPSEKVNPIDNTYTIKYPEINKKQNPKRKTIQERTVSKLKKTKFNSQYSFPPISQDMILSQSLNFTGGTPSRLPQTHVGEVLSNLSGSILFGTKK